MDENEAVQKPSFRGTEGPEYESVCDRVERTFLKSLKSIKDVQSTILDVQSTSWYDTIIR